MATSTKKSASRAVATSGRGSPAAIAKRRVARKLNDFMSGKGEAASARDGRTERRRRRLWSELDKATRRGGEGLKPIDLLRHVHELLELGETLAAIRKVARIRAQATLADAGAAQILREVHAAYHFNLDAYRFLGLPHEVLVEARLADPGAPRRGRPRKAPRPA